MLASSHDYRQNETILGKPGAFIRTFIPGAFSRRSLYHQAIDLEDCAARCIRRESTRHEDVVARRSAVLIVELRARRQNSRADDRQAHFLEAARRMLQRERCSQREGSQILLRLTHVVHTTMALE